MSCTCGSLASAMVSGIETSAPGPGIEIERDRQFGLAADRLEIGDQVGLRRRAGEGPQRRQQLHGGGAPALGVVGKLDRGLERGVRDADHHRHALVGELDGAADQVLALGEAEIGVFLGLDAGGDHHGGAAVLDHVVDLAGEAGFVDLEVGGEGGQRRNDQSGCLHCRAWVTPRVRSTIDIAPAQPLLPGVGLIFAPRPATLRRKGGRPCC